MLTCPKKSHKGFTFLELILVVAILSLIMIGSSPFYGKFFSVNDAASVKTRLVSMLHKAQAYSMTGRDDTSWSVSYSNHQFTLKRVSDNQVFDTFVINNSLTVVGFNNVIFSKMTGVPDNPVTINISGTGSTQNVILGPGGAIGEP